jgi:hypothetical protein
VTGKMVTALRQLGFDGVFDTNFTADLTIMEEGTELLTRLKRALVDGEPMWRCRCSRAARPAGSSSRNTTTPSSCRTSPPASRRSRCSARWPRPTTPRRSGEAPRGYHRGLGHALHRQEVRGPAAGDERERNVQDVDYVLTTRELARMIKQEGHRLRSLPDERDGRPARPFHRRGRHLRQHRRRDGGGAADGLRDRHRPRAAGREPARPACRRTGGHQGPPASRSRARRRTGRSSRA